MIGFPQVKNIMKSITLTIEITDEEFEALDRIRQEGVAEFRDQEYSWDEYKESNKESIERSPETFGNKERFMKRNFYGLKTETLSLFEKDLVDMTEDAWHLTFEITDLGRKFFEAE
jgi:hypothetical protein